MRGHWIGGTRKLNRHWQDGGISLPYSPSQPFDSIEYNGDDYIFAPAYNFDFLINIFSGGYLAVEFQGEYTTETIPQLVSSGTFKIADNVPLKTTCSGMGTDGSACDFYHYKMVNGVETKIVEHMSAGWQSALHHKCIRPYYDLWQLAPRSSFTLWSPDLTPYRDLWSKLKPVQWQGDLNLVQDFITDGVNEYYMPYFIYTNDFGTDTTRPMPLNMYYENEDNGHFYSSRVGPSYQACDSHDIGMGDTLKDINVICADRCCGNTNWGNLPSNPCLPWYLLVGWENTPYLWVLRKLELVENMYWNEVTF